MDKENRYYQPSNSKDAMREMQKLFNTYCNEPLTQQLLQYHLKLQNQLKDNILPVAKNEGISSRIEAAKSMVSIMQNWLQIKLAGKPYNAKMKHFKLVPQNNNTKFKAHTVKVKNNANLRSSRH